MGPYYDILNYIGPHVFLHLHFLLRHFPVQKHFIIPCPLPEEASLAADLTEIVLFFGTSSMSMNFSMQGLNWFRVYF